MASNRLRRVAKELADIEADKDAKQQRISARPAGDGADIMNLIGTIPGAPGTPYEGGLFDISISIPNDYPFRPPKMRFLTKVFHPNISSQTGAICLDTLAKAWSPVLTIKTSLISLQSLFESPEPTDPQDAEVARMMTNTPNLYKKTAHEWAVKYANAPPNPEYLNLDTAPPAPPTGAALYQMYDGYDRQMVDNFAAMGFEIPRIVATLNRRPIVPRGPVGELPHGTQAVIMDELLQDQGD